MSAEAAKVTIGAKRSGVYRAPAQVAALRKAAQEAGQAWVDVPLQAVSSKKQFLAICAKQLQLPSHFGANWDALADCLRDLNALGSKGCILYFRGSEKFMKAAPDDYQTALAVLREAAAFWKDKGTPFIVLVDAAKDLPAF